MDRKKKAILLALSLGSTISMLGSTTALASHEYDAATNTDTYINQAISEEWGGGPGDMKSYDHPDRNLVINWTSDSGRTDGAPLRGGTIKAADVTIDTTFGENTTNWNNKAIIGDHWNAARATPSIIQATGTIVVKAGHHAIFTETSHADPAPNPNDTVIITGFKNLTVESKIGYGISDNGAGIKITGGEGSTIEVTADERYAVGNTHGADSKATPNGTGITLTADKIVLNTTKTNKYDRTVFSGYGWPDKYTVDLNAKDVTIQGAGRVLYGLNGDININTQTDGKVTIISGTNKAIQADEGSQITIHANRDDSTITGDVIVNDKDAKVTEDSKDSKVTILSKGKNFNLTGDLKSGKDSTIDVSILGSDSHFKGNALNDGKTNITLDSNTNWTGDLTANDSGTAVITLNNTSTWDGKAAGNGDISLNDSARWNITADSEANSLKFGTESAIASLAGSARKLTLNELNGSGTFLMDLKYQDDDVATYREGTDSDYIIAKTGDGGTHKVSLTNDSNLTGMTNDSKLYFATTGADTSTFKANENLTVMQKSKITDKNLLVKKDTDTTDAYSGDDNWYLTLKDQEKPAEPDNPPAPGPNDPVNPNGLVPGKAYSSALALWRENDALHKRLGELRYGEDEEGVWARYYNMKLERDGSHGFRSNYKNLQVGVDKKAVRTNGDWYYGLAVEHLWGKPSYAEGSGDQKMTDVALYGTNVKKDDSFLDYTFKVGRINSDYDTSYGDHGNFDNWATAIGAEYGKRYALGNQWTIEPQAQLTYNYLWGEDYTTKNGARVSQDNADSLVGRLGFLLARELHPELKTPSRIYVKASIHHDFLGDTTSTIADDVRFTDNDDLGDTWYTVGLGTDLRIKDGVQFYFDAEKNFGADVDMKYRFNAGLRFDF